jgi:hypothetical protein
VIHNTSHPTGLAYRPIIERSCSSDERRRAAMTAFSVNTRTASNRFDAIFAAVIASCADFCAGARQGRDIEGRFHELARRSDPDLERLGLIRSDIARAALDGRHH